MLGSAEDGLRNSLPGILPSRNIVVADLPCKISDDVSSCTPESSPHPSASSIGNELGIHFTVAEEQRPSSRQYPQSFSTNTYKRKMRSNFWKSEAPRKVGRKGPNYQCVPLKAARQTECSHSRKSRLATENVDKSAHLRRWSRCKNSDRPGWKVLSHPVLLLIQVPSKLFNAGKFA